MLYTDILQVPDVLSVLVYCRYLTVNHNFHYIFSNHNIKSKSHYKSKINLLIPQTIVNVIAMLKNKDNSLKEIHETQKVITLIFLEQTIILLYCNIEFKINDSTQQNKIIRC